VHFGLPGDTFERRNASMGILDGLLPRYKPSPIPVEGVVGVWTAARTSGGFSLAGGQVVLTAQHLIFSPWDMDQAREWLLRFLGAAGAPPMASKIDQLITKSRLLEPVALPLEDITSVEVLNRASITKPPTARLHLRDGNHFDLGILASPRSPNVSRANNEAFDDWRSRMPRPSSR
jgi:hypothetical protein